MNDPRARLTRLIELATQTAPEHQRALAFELCDLLLEWPARYPPAMREPFEALLEKVLRRLDATTRRLIGARFAQRRDATLTLLNEVYLDVPIDIRATILHRNAELGDSADTTSSPAPDETALLAAARALRGTEFASAFARVLGIPDATAKRIVDDSTGNALAVACKGAHLQRATFSALALLATVSPQADTQARYAGLDAYDEIPASGAEHLLAYWRKAHDDRPPLESESQAA